MSLVNHCTVKELASVLNGIVEAGHGDAPVTICLDHGTENKDEIFDLSIDNISIRGTFDDVFITFDTYLFNSTLNDLLKSFGIERGDCI